MPGAYEVHAMESLRLACSAHANSNSGHPLVLFRPICGCGSMRCLDHPNTRGWRPCDAHCAWHRQDPVATVGLTNRAMWLLMRIAHWSCRSALTTKRPLVPGNSSSNFRGFLEPAAGGYAEVQTSGRAARPRATIVVCWTQGRYQCPYSLPRPSEGKCRMEMCYHSVVCPSNIRARGRVWGNLEVGSIETLGTLGAPGGAVPELCC